PGVVVRALVPGVVVAGLVVHSVHVGNHDVDVARDAVRVGVVDRRRHQGAEVGVGGVNAAGARQNLRPGAILSAGLVAGVVVGPLEPAALAEVIGPGLVI